MTSRPDNPIQRVIKKFAYAFEGLFDGMLHDFIIQLQFGFAAFALLVAILMRFTVMETAVLLICIGLVVSFEYLNSALGSMIDHLEPNFSKEAKIAKDLGAASVGLSALISLIIGLLFIFNHR